MLGWFRVQFGYSLDVFSQKNGTDYSTLLLFKYLYHLSHLKPLKRKPLTNADD